MVEPTLITPTVDVLDFTLPPELEATEPAEVRGAGRDDVRLLMAERAEGRITHRRFADLATVLRPGDLLVLNTSGTLPAAVAAVGPHGEQLELHMSTELPQHLWLVEVRVPDGPASRPWDGSRPGDTLALPGTASVRLFTPADAAVTRLWVAELSLPAGADVVRWLGVHGRPIRYSYTGGDWPLSAYQTVYATEPGSAEMPSAGRAFTPELLTRAVAAGVDVAPLVLHTGVSSLEEGELPYPERYRVPADTARRVNAARADGGRVVAVGTTVVRALETTVDDRGRVHPGEGWTDVVITPERGVHAVDGLLTGWHEPRASHLRMLEAVAGRPLLEAAYEAALAARYRWHEFGDLCLII